MGLGKYSEQFISRCCTSSWASSTKFYASSLILSSLHGGAVLAVDRLVAILALAWSPAAFATSKSFGETGTLEFDVNEASKEDHIREYAWRMENLGLSWSRRSNIGDLATSSVSALVVTVLAAWTYQHWVYGGGLQIVSIHGLHLQKRSSLHLHPQKTQIQKRSSLSLFRCHYNWSCSHDTSACVLDL